MCVVEKIQIVNNQICMGENDIKFRSSHFNQKNAHQTNQTYKREIKNQKPKSDHITLIDLSPEAIEEEEEGIRKGTVFNTYRM